MTKLNVYLAKSNRSDPTTVSRVRIYLQNHAHVLKILEFKGGEYNNRDLISASLVVFVAEPCTSTIGKGLYEQIKDCREKNVPFLFIYTSDINYYVIEDRALGTHIKGEINSFVNYANISFNTNSPDVRRCDSLDGLLTKYVNSGIHLLVKEQEDFEKELESKPKSSKLKDKPLMPKDCSKSFDINSEDLLLLVNNNV